MNASQQAHARLPPAAGAGASPAARRRGSVRSIRGAVRLAARSGTQSGGESAAPTQLSLLPPRAGAPLWEVSAGRAAAPARTSTVAVAPPLLPAAAELLSPTTALAAGGVLAAAFAAKAIFGKPARAYEPGSVGREYDAWTREGILEYYWGARGACAVVAAAAQMRTPVRSLARTSPNMR
jgi:MPBQ/MSBQ methyltransferase